MQTVQLFKSADFGEIRTLIMDNEPWIVGRDVAEILGYSNSRDALANHVDEEDKGVAKFNHHQRVWFVQSHSF